MKLHATLLLLVGLLLAADKPKEDTAKKDHDKLQGTWKLVSEEANGDPYGAEDLGGGQLTIQGDKYTFKQGDMTEEGTLKIDPSKKPATIDLTINTGQDKGKTQVGIYKLDGEQLSACFAKAGEKERPKEFNTKKGSDHILFGFKRGDK